MRAPHRSPFPSIAAIILVLVLPIAGCTTAARVGPVPGEAVHIDLSTSHAVTQAPAPLRHDSLHLDHPGPVTLRLPGGRTFEGGDDVASLAFEAIGAPAGQLHSVRVGFERLTTDEAYAKATALRDEWVADPAGHLDRWHDERVRQRADGHEDVMTTVSVNAPDGVRLGGADGPGVGLEIQYSFDPDRPGAVSLVFVWSSG